MSPQKNKSIVFSGKAAIQALYHLHADALDLQHDELAEWALHAHNDVCNLLTNIPRDNPYKPLIPVADRKG